MQYRKIHSKGVYLDSTLLEGLSEKEQKQMVKERIKELGGQSFTAYDQNNTPVQIEIAPKGIKFTNKRGKRVDVSHDLSTKKNDDENKRIIVVHADEIIEAASFDSVSPSKYTHGWLDNFQKNPWDTWKVYVQQKNNSVWEAQLRIANSQNGEKYLYDVVEIKMVEGGGTSPHTTTINNIPQTVNNNNGKNVSGNNSQTQQRNNGSASTSQGKFSLKIRDKDSQGNKLSEEQKKYFNDSKVVDNTGALMTVYHQTDVDFTEFRTKSTGAGRYDHELPDGIFTKPDDNDIGLKGKKQMICLWTESTA